MKRSIPYRPSVIAWPKLSPTMLQRLTSLPIWDIAVHTESRARLRFAAYANSRRRAEVRSAIMLNAWEESRHKEVLAKLVEAYGITVASEPPFLPPRDPEWAYLVTGYCECIDSFFAFGLFELAVDRASFRPNWSRRSSPSSRRNAATSCCSPTGGVAPRKPAVVAAPPVRASRRGGLDRHRLGRIVLARSMDAKGERRASGQQLHREQRPRGEPGRDRFRRSDDALPGRRMIADSRAMIRDLCARPRYRRWPGLRSLSQSPGPGKRHAASVQIRELRAAVSGRVSA